VKHPVTPDGRFFVVRGRLWRMSNPFLDEAERDDLVHRLMAARRAVRDAKGSVDLAAQAAAHKAVDKVKRELGERGPVWWDDGSPNLNSAYGEEHALCRVARKNRGAREEVKCRKPSSSIWT
jgi:hypothetical protein